MKLGLIVDLVLVAIVLLMVVLGIKRGLVKTCVGLVSTILVIVIAVFTVSPVTNIIFGGTTWDDSLRTTLETPIAEKMPNAYAKIYYYDLDADATTEPELIFEIDNKKDKFENILAGNSVTKVLNVQKFIRPSVEKILEQQKEGMEEGSSLSENNIDFIDAVTVPLTTYIFLAGVFIILLILARILIWLLLKLFKKLISKLYVVHFVDKMLGGLFGLAVGCLVIFIVLTIVQLMSSLTFMAPVNAFLEDTIVTKFIMEHNFLYTFLVENIKIGDLLGSFKLGG